MPTLVNHMPFPNFRFYSTDNAGREFGVIIVKGTFEIGDDGQLTVAEEQAPMLFDDQDHGELNLSSLWHPADTAPVKPTADIIVNAVARAPGGEPLPTWECGIKVDGPEGPLVEKRLHVTGPRAWVPRWRRPLDEEDRADWRQYRKLFQGWELSEPEPTTEVPLRYELAFGGTIQTGTDDDGKPRWTCEPRNPVGRGFIDPEWTDHTRQQPAPQIETPGAPITDPYARPAPQSLGPIPMSWAPRLQKGGTFDQNWMDNIWPNWPPDYDFAYNNSAHPDLICPRHLEPGDRVTLDNLMPGDGPRTIVVPPVQPIAGLVCDDGRAARRPMHLDTLFLDIGARRRDARVFLSWRVRFERGLFKAAVLIEQRDIEGLETMMKRAAA